MAEATKTETLVRVLVIEDDPLDRELLLRQLQKSSMDSQVRFISDGREALELFTSPNSRALAQELIAIFLDLNLPSLGGLEFLRRLRSYTDFQDIPVIVMTSSTDPSDLRECRLLKVSNYVSKPVTVTSFSKAVADVFHQPRTDDHGVGVEEN